MKNHVANADDGESREPNAGKGRGGGVAKSRKDRGLRRSAASRLSQTRSWDMGFARDYNSGEGWYSSYLTRVRVCVCVSV